MYNLHQIVTVYDRFFVDNNSESYNNHSQLFKALHTISPFTTLFWVLLSTWQCCTCSKKHNLVSPWKCPVLCSFSNLSATIQLETATKNWYIAGIVDIWQKLQNMIWRHNMLEKKSSTKSLPQTRNNQIYDPVTG